MVLDETGSYIENKATKEKILLKECGGTFIFEVEPEGRKNPLGFARRG